MFSLHESCQVLSLYIRSLEGSRESQAEHYLELGNVSPPDFRTPGNSSPASVRTSGHSWGNGSPHERNFDRPLHFHLSRSNQEKSHDHETDDAGRK